MDIKQRTARAREIQKERFRGTPTAANAQMSHRQVRKYCELGTEESDLLKTAITELNLSARAHDKILVIV